MPDQIKERRSHDILALRMDRIETGHEELKQAMATNTAMTLEIKNNTDELVELFKTAKGGFKTASWLGGAIKTISATVAAVIGAYLAVRAWLEGG